MIKRIVKLTFREEEIETFQKIFEESKELIQDFEGCLHLELLQGINEPAIFFTYSFWESEGALNNYRHSELFRKTWSKTKVLFAGKPEAWSVSMIYPSVTTSSPS